jgi:hypothetical protein
MPDQQFQELKDLIITSHASLHSDLTVRLIRLETAAEGTNAHLARLNGKVAEQEKWRNETDVRLARHEGQIANNNKVSDKVWYFLWLIPASAVGWFINKHF